MTLQDSARPTQSNTLRQGLHRSLDPESSESTHEASFPARRMDNQLKWGKAAQVGQGVMALVAAHF